MPPSNPLQPPQPPRQYTSLTLIFSPHHTGLHAIGPGAGPNHLRTRANLTAASLSAEFNITVYETEIEPLDNDTTSNQTGEIARSFEILRRTSRAVSDACSSTGRNSFPVVIAGNCTASVGVAAGLLGAAGKGVLKEGMRMGCIWFDAHDDYNTPDTLTSGYFDSMPIAMLAGECWGGMLASVPGWPSSASGRDGSKSGVVELRDVMHVGMRDMNEVERGRVVKAGFDVVWGGEREEGGGVDFREGLNEILERKQLGKVMVHVDLDCLDISHGVANAFSTVPGGLTDQDLYGCLKDIIVEDGEKEVKTEPLSLTVASFDPGYEGGEKIAEIGVEAIKTFVGVLVEVGMLRPAC